MTACLYLIHSVPVLAQGSPSRILLVAAIAIATIITIAVLRLRRKRASPKMTAADQGREQSPPPAIHTLESARPKMLLDSIFLPTEAGGVYFRSRGGVF